MSTTFRAFGDIVIMGRQQFQQANGNINNYYLANKGSSSTQGEDEKRLMPIQDQFREFRRGDIIIRSEVHSSEMMMNIVTKFKLTNPFQPLRMVKIRRKMCSVELVNFRDCKFTLFLFEPENKEDKDMVAIIWKQIYDGLSTHTSPLLTQVFGLCQLNIPAFVLHDELANGDDFIDRFDNGKNKVVAVYLLYTLASSIQVLGVEFSVSDEEADWNFNLKTLSWQYDIAPTSVLLPDDLSIWGFFRIPPLCQNTLPQLQINEIIAWSQQHFNDFLCLIATFIEITYRDFNLSEFASRGLLTFGAVVHRQKGIIAHFPSLPSPEQSLENFSRDICASYSKEVPSRINFKFCRPGNLVMSFEVRLPTRFVAAYLGQSSPFVHNLEHPEDDIVFINKIWILLVGTFLHDPTTQSTPVFLFIPPIPVENINGVYCVRYPLPEQLFYWSLDTDGKDAILEKDWEKYGVPKLGTEINIASEWDSDICTHIWEYLLSRNYNLDGKQYARDHGYPELMRGDPHDIWFQAESFSLVELFGEDQPDNDSGATKVVDLIVSNTRLDSRVHSEISIEDGAVNTANISIRQETIGPICRQKHTDLKADSQNPCVEGETYRSYLMLIFAKISRLMVTSKESHFPDIPRARGYSSRNASPCPDAAMRSIMSHYGDRPLERYSHVMLVITFGIKRGRLTQESVIKRLRMYFPFALQTGINNSYLPPRSR